MLWVTIICSTNAVCLTSAKLIPSVQLTDTTGTTVQRPTGQSNPINPITVVTNSSRLANGNKASIKRVTNNTTVFTKSKTKTAYQ